MADRGFTIKDLLTAIGADLNLPPFLKDKKQLSPQEVREGRSIASVRIHVELAIGRMKHYRILSGTIRLKMAQVADHIVTVCAYLSNFHPALVPAPEEDTYPPTSTPSLQPCSSQPSKSHTTASSSDITFSLSESITEQSNDDCDFPQSGSSSSDCM